MPHRDASGKHVWTDFEKHTLFCLMVRNVHVTGIIVVPEEDYTNPLTDRERKKHGIKKTNFFKGGLEVSQKQAHMDVATLLNETINTTGEYEGDIDFKEVSKMITTLLEEKKAAFAYMERNNKGRVTRAMRQIWNRGLGFTGSKQEWEAGRREGERYKRDTGFYDLQQGQDKADVSAWVGITANSIIAGNSVGAAADVWGEAGANGGGAAAIEKDFFGDNSFTAATAFGVEDLWGDLGTTGPSAALQDAANAWTNDKISKVQPAEKLVAEDPWGVTTSGTASHSFGNNDSQKSKPTTHVTMAAEVAGGANITSTTTNAHDPWGPNTEIDPIVVRSTEANAWTQPALLNEGGPAQIEDPWSNIGCLGRSQGLSFTSSAAEATKDLDPWASTEPSQSAGAPFSSTDVWSTAAPESTEQRFASPDRFLEMMSAQLSEPIKDNWAPDGGLTEKVQLGATTTSMDIDSALSLPTGISRNRGANSFRNSALDPNDPLASHLSAQATTVPSQEPPKQVALINNDPWGIIASVEAKEPVADVWDGCTSSAAEYSNHEGDPWSTSSMP